MLRNAFENLATEDTQLTNEELLRLVLYVLINMHDKMPRVDSADRMIVTQSEVFPTVYIASSQTLGTVNTVTNVAGITQVGGRDAANYTYALANAGAMHIYDNIRIT